MYSVHKLRLQESPNVDTPSNPFGQWLSSPWFLADKINIFKRFKRYYVESQTYGVPFLSGTNITQISPRVKYLSKLMHEKDIENLKIKKGWILVTCSGTIGNVALVGNEWDNWALTQHAIRIIPNTEKIQTGYLYAYLCTEYAQSQILSNIHGSVKDEINSNQLSRIKVPLIGSKLQQDIHLAIIEAYDKISIAKSLIRDQIEKICNKIEKKVKSSI